jgi:6-phosphogluconolactonase
MFDLIVEQMKLHVFKDAGALNIGAADWIVSVANETFALKDKFSFLLSGGNTPKKLYELLASDAYRNKINWERVDIFFGDERVVPFEDERNNGKMAFDSLLSKVPIPKEQIHFINTSIAPQDAAQNYEQLLRNYFEKNKTTFDVSLLGMGDDGHTLSVFPGTEKNLDKSKWVFHLYMPSQKMYRISLSPFVVNQSVNIAFLVTGNSKTPVLKNILQQQPPDITYPAQLIRAANGQLHWFIDEAAFPR